MLGAQKVENRTVAGALAFVLVVVGVVVVAMATVGSAAAATPGSITGRVLSAPDGQPIEGVCVSLDSGPQTVTASDGTYTIGNIDPGTYSVSYRDCTPSPQFVSQWYLGADSAKSATPVAVSDGTDTPLADVSLTVGVVVRGTVTGDGAPLAGANVQLNATSSGYSTGTSTDADGDYATEPVPVGSYQVRFTGGAAPGAWAPQFWNGKPSAGTADPLVLSAADVPSRAGVDAALTGAARISGTVTDATGSPLGDVCVEAQIVHDGTTDWVGGATTDAAGTYVIDSLPTAPLLVHFRDCTPGDHLEQWYQGATSPDTATSVKLSPGEDRQGIDAQLADGIVVAGRVTDSGGAPIGGISVYVNSVSSGPGGYAQTDGDGNYRTNGLAPGDYRVQFSAPGPNPAWATQFWSGRLTWNSADLLHLDASDVPARGGIDAVMTAAATISGVVRDQNANPVGKVCVSAIIDTVTGPDYAGGTTSAPDGTYSIGALPAATTRVQFDDCNHVGPYVQQWWNQQRSYATATALAVTPGSAITGIDASLERAGAITGHVTDRKGNPVSGICAQASNDQAFGGLARTDGSGNYTILLTAAGSFRVQFVDCNDTPTYRGQWWDDQPTAATASLVTVGSGETVDHVDAHLDPGVGATISGRVATLRGTALEGACVVAYLPNQFARFAPVASDGSYTITDVPSGTFALAALSCGGEDPSPVVPDPSVAGVAYRALWWNQVPLLFDQSSDGGPDPIAQHADLVEVTPGAALTDYDFCFGCGGVELQDVTPSGTSVSLSYATRDLIPPDTSIKAVLPDVSYTTTCSSSSAGASRAASTTAQSVVVSDLTPGATYTCDVLASVDGVAVASSVSSNTFTVPGSAAPEVAKPSDRAALAFTGRSLDLLGALAIGMILSGAALVMVTRRRRSRLV